MHGEREIPCIKLCCIAIRCMGRERYDIELCCGEERKWCMYVCPVSCWWAEGCSQELAHRCVCVCIVVCMCVHCVNCWRRAFVVCICKCVCVCLCKLRTTQSWQCTRRTGEKNHQNNRSQIKGAERCSGSSSHWRHKFKYDIVRLRDCEKKNWCFEIINRDRHVLPVLGDDVEAEVACHTTM